MCINLELKSVSFSFVFKTWLFSDIYYCWHQVRCERETYETRGTDWVSCPVSQSIHHLQLCFSRICICVCLSINPPPLALFFTYLYLYLSLNQSTTSSFVFLVFVFVFVSQTIHHHPLCFVFALVSCPVSQLMHQSTTSDFVFLVFVFVSIPVSRIPINPPCSFVYFCIWISILACLSIIHQYLS